MRKEKCCGAIVFHDGKFLLVKHKNGGHIAFPKGHMERGESEEDTAIREVFEETGLNIKIIDGFRYEMVYKIYNNTLKKVVFFQGEKISGKEKTQEDEISDLMWVTYEEAYKLLTHEDSKKMLNSFMDYQKVCI